MWLVYVLSIAAALFFGTGSVIQQRAAAQAPPQDQLSWRLLLWLAQRPIWLAGVGTAVLGNICSAVALGHGSVALVQPLLVVRLLFALPLSAAWSKRSVPSRDWLGAALTTAGLAAFIVAGRPHQVSNQASVPELNWIVGGGLLAGLATVLTLLARRMHPPRQAALLGAGAGFLFGLQAALVGAAFDVLGKQGVLALLTNWKLYAVIVVALAGTLLIQSAYEAAPLPASFPPMVTAEPLTGIALGVGVLGGSIRLSAVDLAIEIGGLGVMCAGIYLLASSPLVTGQLDRLERRQRTGQAERTAEELERDLQRLHRDLDPFEVHIGTDRLSGKDLGQVRRDLARVDRELQRLRELRAEIDRHRRRELHYAAERANGHLFETPPRDVELDRAQQRIDTRTDRLAELAGGLREGARHLQPDGDR